MSDTIKHLKQMLHKNPFDDETRLRRLGVARRFVVGRDLLLRLYGPI